MEVESISGEQAEEILADAGKLKEFYYYFGKLPQDVPEGYKWNLNKTSATIELKFGGTQVIEYEVPHILNEHYCVITKMVGQITRIFKGF